MKNLGLLAGSVLLLVVGLQVAQPAQAAAIDNGSFMSLWKNYSHCQATTDLDQMREDASILADASNRSLSQEGFVLPLPGKLEQFVSTPKARYAVDVTAMAAACSLRAGLAAVEAGKIAIAKDLLEPILSLQPQSEYEYYTLQARELLSGIDTKTFEVTLNRP